MTNLINIFLNHQVNFIATILMDVLLTSKFSITWDIVRHTNSKIHPEDRIRNLRCRPEISVLTSLSSGHICCMLKVENPCSVGPEE